MTKSEVLVKMNNRHGWDHTDYFMLLVALKRTAGNHDRLGKRIPASRELAAMIWADYNEALGAEEDSTSGRELSTMSQDERNEWHERCEALQEKHEARYDADPLSCDKSY